MPVVAISPDYRGEVRDKVDNYHGNYIIYIGWDQHLMFCAPFAFLLSPQVSFQEVINNVLPTAIQSHPDFSQIQWDKTEWLHDGKPFIPSWNKSLLENGLHHKSSLRLRTPALQGLNGSGS
ncbi:phenol hydroxylase subunit P4 [Beggiatoa leptomitoformis]|uniref:Phenol hydroxylase n=1 Tax=Beggiatoa leptomitoformis TaxID=288004 RepID=A0A2N9YC75_9GAMM|nr:phenol hydroxylase subunit P4 [Beggiatoa leptomitoformis]ALG66622.1 phenol hydroxylase [Beggiatoa leptomitoformis]AUI68068.1 phenol hydroxylase [Beggiatoa leptomitoformis]